MDVGTLSEPYEVDRRVKQGSLLSVVLFLLIMDPLLTQLHSSDLGLSINIYAGGFLHADGIRTLATSSESLEAKLPMVEKFTREIFLKLNLQKCS